MKVAIVGAGVSGLVTLKECLAEGIEADVFEGLDHIGGLWAYREAEPDVVSSAYEGLRWNSCRDTSSFTDFPLDPARYPDYLSHREYLGYLEEYAKFFDLKRHIKFNTKVQSCKPIDNGWLVETIHQGKSQEETYDAVFTCSGHNSTPSVPDFAGRSSFQGEFIHSHYYRKPDVFDGKRVAIIGMGSSAADITAELVGHAKEIHVISRRGTWIIPRYCFGKPVEYFDSRATQTILPKSIAEFGQKLLMDYVQGKHPPELRPEHKILEANPTLHTDFIAKLRAGNFKIHRAGVEAIQPNGIQTTTGETLEVDVILCCTGYKIEYPYLPLDTYRPKTPTESHSPLSTSQALNLYELIHPVNYTNLFFIGLPEIPGALPPVAELQARWSIGILSGRIPLPSPQQMAQGIADFQAEQARLFIHSPRHAAATPLMAYCDRLAAQLDGANPSFAKLFGRIFSSGHPLQSLRLLNAVYNTIPNPAQYRLFGHGNCHDMAVESMLRTAGGNKQLSTKEREWMEKGGDGES